MGAEKNLLYMAKGLLEARNDFTLARKYKDEYKSLLQFIEDFNTTYEFRLAGLTQRDDKDFNKVKRNILLSGFPFDFVMSVTDDMSDNIKAGIPTYLVPDYHIGCDFIEISKEFPKPRGFRFSCINRDIAIQDLKESNGGLSREKLFRWSKSQKCFKGFDKNHLPHPKCTRFNYEKENKPCNYFFRESNEGKHFGESIIWDDWCGKLSELIGVVRKILPVVKRRRRIPISNFSSFVDLAIYQAFMGDNIFDLRVSKETEEIRKEMEITKYHSRMVRHFDREVSKSGMMQSE